MADRDLTHCCSLLRVAIPSVLFAFDQLAPTRRLFIVETMRSLADQQHAFAVGRTIPPLGSGHILTKCDGVTTVGPHQAQMKHGEGDVSHAVDLGVLEYQPAAILWRYSPDRETYRPLLVLAEKYGLRSGWDWNCNGRSDDEKWIDAPHVECRGV